MAAAQGAVTGDRTILGGTDWYRSPDSHHRSLAGAYPGQVLERRANIFCPVFLADANHHRAYTRVHPRLVSSLRGQVNRNGIRLLAGKVCLLRTLRCGNVPQQVPARPCSTIFAAVSAASLCVRSPVVGSASGFMDKYDEHPCCLARSLRDPTN